LISYQPDLALGISLLLDKSSQSNRKTPAKNRGFLIVKMPAGNTYLVCYYEAMARRPEKRIPNWAEKERGNDMNWIRANLHILWPTAQAGYEAVGRGALWIDTTQTFAHPGGVGHPFGYFDQATVEQREDEDTKRMVREYDPSWEMVTTLFKTQDRLSTYRIGVIPPGSRENLGSRKGKN
jgi:hypothetical protein